MFSFAASPHPRSDRHARSPTRGSGRTTRHGRSDAEEKPEFQRRHIRLSSRFRARLRISFEETTGRMLPAARRCGEASAVDDAVNLASVCLRASDGAGELADLGLETTGCSRDEGDAVVNRAVFTRRDPCRRRVGKLAEVLSSPPAVPSWDRARSSNPSPWLCPSKVSTGGSSPWIPRPTPTRVRAPRS